LKDEPINEKTKKENEGIKISEQEREDLRIQYNKLAEDWRQFNTILWGIPAVAVSIMAGIIVVAYQSGMAGPARLVSLIIGSIFLFALTLEVIKKRLHMNVISYILKQLQGEHGLNLKSDFRFPVGYSDDVENYWDNKDDKDKDWLYKKLRRRKARVFLAYVTLFAALAVAILAAIESAKMIWQIWL